MRSLRPFALVCAFFSVSMAAHAATTTYNINFQTFGGYNELGSFTLTFDPTVNTIGDVTNGFTVNYLSFKAPPSGFNYDMPAGELEIGGLVTSVTGIRAGTDDFTLTIYGFPTNPFFDLFVRTQVGSDQYETTYQGYGSVSVTKIALTPEPSSVLLLTTGVLGMGAVLRRKFALNQG